MHSISHWIGPLVAHRTSCYNASIIRTIASFREIQDRLKTLTSSDMLVLDVDDLLFTPKDRVLRGCHKNPDHPMHRIYSMEGKEQEYWYSLCYSQTEYQEVESGMSSLVHEIQQLNVPVIAITAFKTPSYGIIEDTVAVRLEELRQFGYDFTDKTHPDVYELDPLENGSQQIVASGVIFSSQKGPALKMYCQGPARQQGRIVALDNERSHLESILSCFPSHAECYHLTAASLLPGTLTKEQEMFQVDHFLKTKQWLSESQIRCLHCRNISAQMHR